MSALEDLKKLQDAVRKEVLIIQNFMGTVGITVPTGSEEDYVSAARATDNLQRLVQTDSGNIGITVPTGGLGVKGQ